MTALAGKGPCFAVRSPGAHPRGVAGLQAVGELAEKEHDQSWS